MIRRIRNGLLIGVAVFLLGACSKTVTWEEEVPLNTGEVIWVKRSVEYSVQGDAGNPMDLAWRPKKEQKLEFEWKSRKHKYEGAACLQVLAIHSNRPVLIGDAWCQSLQWTHKYDPCEAYVQLNYDQSGQWIWPPKPEEWVFGLKTNLVIDFTNPNRLEERISTNMRDSYKTKDPRAKSQIEVVRLAPESFENPNCRKARK